MKRRGKTGFVKDENGSATIEAVLWMPVFVFILVLIFDVSMMFHNQARLLGVTQTAARFYAVGNENLARNYLQSQVAAFSTNAISGENFDFDIPEAGIVRSWVSVDAGDLGGVGMLKVISGIRINVSSHQMVEG